MNHLLVLAFSLFFIQTFPTLAQTADTKLFKRADSCKATGDRQTPIIIVKQWHLAPGTNTKLPMKKVPEQTQNLLEIEKQLGKWIEAKSIKTLIAEGCEGKLDDSTAFNGWSLGELKAKSKSPEFESLVTHPVLKLEAKYGNRIESWCGDLKQEIQEELLAFSDARAAVGYLTRIRENQKDPTKQKIYVDGAIEAYHFPPDTKPEAIQPLLKQELKKSIARIKELNLKRSHSFASTAMILRDDPIVLVVGGMHAKGIMRKLEEKRRDCVVYEPRHYSQNEDQLIDELDRIIR